MRTALLAAARAALHAWNRERRIARAIGELNEMDDRQLADLGLAREEIGDYARGRHAATAAPPRGARQLRLVPAARG